MERQRPSFREKFKPFIRGMVSVFDISGRLIYPKREIPKRTDGQAIRSDWDAVSEYFRGKNV